MATFRKVGKKTRAEIAVLGIRMSKMHDTKAQAVAWAAINEADILSGKNGGIPNKTFGDLLTKYRDEVTPTKRGKRWEEVRINMYLRDPIAQVHLRDLDSTHFTKWRDRRLAKVGAGSVLREWNILSNALRRARDEWKWLTENPLKGVARPTKPKARERIAAEEEMALMEQCSGYNKTVPLKTATLRTMAAFLFATETALRAGEICALERHEVFIEKEYLKVTGIKPGARKNNAAVRDVWMNPRAIEILKQVLASHDDSTVFNVCATTMDALFRKVRDRACIVDLNFHDSRHAGITALARVYDVLDLARIVGHTNIQELMTYYNPTIEDMVKRGAQKWKLAQDEKRDLEPATV